MENEIESRLHFLEESRNSHYRIVEVMHVSEGFSLLDMFAWMVLKRSISLVYGFVALIRAKNLISAAPLVRLQIDNLLRFRAAFLVADSDEFIHSILSGTPIRRLKDIDEKPMTDAYLQQKFLPEYPWIQEMYKKTSGYIHLSEEHFFNTVRASGKGEGAIEAYIGPDDRMVSSEIYSEAVETMILITNSLLTYMAEWVQQVRSNP
ncbi:MAG TPA: hypothetical protein VN937_02420 [Blastocatellia bacterium]|nr:hypothetical protein [Blastocatellia bacterium]